MLAKMAEWMPSFPAFLGLFIRRVAPATSCTVIVTAGVSGVYIVLVLWSYTYNFLRQVNRTSFFCAGMLVCHPKSVRTFPTGTRTIPLD